MLTAPVETGKTRTVIDANGERATVVEITEKAHASASVAGVTADAETTRPACVAPS